MDEQLKVLTSRYMFGLTKQCPSLNQYSIWMLIGTGAAVTFLISNLKTLNESVHLINLKFAFAFLAISSLLGFLARYCNQQVQMKLSLIEEVNLAVVEIEGAEKYKKEAYYEFLKIFPLFVRMKAEKAMLKSETDPLLGPRLIAKTVVRQGYYVFTQFFSLICTIVMFTLGIK